MEDARLGSELTPRGEDEGACTFAFGEHCDVHLRVGRWLGLAEGLGFAWSVQRKSENSGAGLKKLESQKEENQKLKARSGQER